MRVLNPVNKVEKIVKKVESLPTKKIAAKAPAPKVKAMETEVEITEFKGHPMFSIVDVEAKKAGKVWSSVVQCGLRKAKAILKHIEELQAFVDSQSA